MNDEDDRKLKEKEQIEDIVAMLDQFMSDGGGHMNVIMNEGAVVNEKAVETFRAADCGSGTSAAGIPSALAGGTPSMADGFPAMACQVPTLHQGIDDGEEEEAMDESYSDEED